MADDYSIYTDYDLENTSDPYLAYNSDNLNLSDYFKSLPSDVTGTGSFSDILKGLGSVLSGKSSLGASGSVAGMLGIAALANKLLGGSGGGGFAGYKGNIPTYTATRTMNTIPTTMTVPVDGGTKVVPRRPGSGGITYFSPMVYTPVQTTGASGNDTVAGGNDTVTGASGGIMSLRDGHLGSYSDGGQLLRGPGDGVSDDIPATIADKQPARLANNEFVIPARIVSEIGNGSTEAGAAKLYEMMRRVQKRREKTVGKNKVAVDSKAYKELDKL
jgi:hypothetical protein